jgi:hypothetical protein
VKASCVALATASKIAHRKNNNDGANGAHDKAESDIASGFDAGLARGKSAAVDAIDSAVGDDKSYV